MRLGRGVADAFEETREARRADALGQAFRQQRGLVVFALAELRGADGDGQHEVDGFRVEMGADAALEDVGEVLGDPDAPLVLEEVDEVTGGAVEGKDGAGEVEGGRLKAAGVAEEVGGNVAVGHLAAADAVGRLGRVEGEGGEAAPADVAFRAVRHSAAERADARVENVEELGEDVIHGSETITYLL